MRRLIAADYDGTLLPAGKEALSPAFFNKVRCLTSRGMVFAVASGRPYHQLKELFFPVAGEIVFIANDGAQMMYRNMVLGKAPICPRICGKLCGFAALNGMTPLACQREKTVSVPANAPPFFFSTDVFKLVLVKNGKNTASVLALAKELQLRVCYEDDAYLEFCRMDADKGAALQLLMKKFDVAGSQAAVFGDGYNDLPMLQCVGERFVMENAPQELKACATTVIGDAAAYIEAL